MSALDQDSQMVGRAVKRGLLVFALLAAAPLVSSPSADAVIGGDVDGTAHPYVGAIDGRVHGRGFGSGVLVSPTVYVTAGHATRFFDDAGLTRARVTFDPVATDAAATFHEGTVHTHPGFSGRFGDPNDVGVVVFDSPIPGITPAQFPSANLLGELGPQGLHDQLFKTVGFGTQALLGGANGGGPPDIDRPSRGTRKSLTERFKSLDSSTLHLQMHEDGQTCTGDSGSPSLFEGTNRIAGVSVAGDGACKSMDEHIRLDTPRVRSFLGQYVTLP